MNAPLRRRHRVASALLALVLPAGLAAALLARPEVSRANDLAELERGSADAEQGWRPVALAWSGASPAARLSADGSELELTPPTGFAEPDVLVLWSPGAGADGRHVVGTLAGERPRRYALPAAARGRAGRVALYALAHGEELSAAELPPTAPGGGGR